MTFLWRRGEGGGGRKGDDTFAHVNKAEVCVCDWMRNSLKCLYQCYICYSATEIQISRQGNNWKRSLAIDKTIRSFRFSGRYIRVLNKIAFLSSAVWTMFNNVIFSVLYYLNRRKIRCTTCMCFFNCCIETFKPGTSTQSSIKGTLTTDAYFPTANNNMMGPVSWFSGQSFWLLIMRSQVRFPALPWEFSLKGWIPRWPWSG